MKKTFLTIAIVLSMSIGAFAQGGLFGYGEVDQEEEEFDIAWYSFYQDQDDVDNSLFGLLRGSFAMPGLPNHGSTNNENAPLGSGAALLIGLGAAYALKKRSKK